MLRFAALGVYLVAAVLLLAGSIPTALAAPPANDDFGGAAAVGALPFTATANTAEATKAAYDPSACTS